MATDKPLQTVHGRRSLTNTEDSRDAAETLADVVYMGMPQIWPRFVDEYGVEPNSAWITAMQGLTLMGVQEALRRCARSTNAKPLTPGQFRALTQSIEQGGAHQSRGRAAPAKTLVDAAYQRCCLLMSKRILTKLGVSPDYDGVLPEQGLPDQLMDFPFKRVVIGTNINGLDFTRQNPRNEHDHREAFARLRKRFNEAWTSFSATQQGELNP